MAQLELENISKRYGEFYAVRNVTLNVAHGEFLVLLGPSGCGKTTTLRVIAGFADPTAGAVRISGREVTTLPAWKRNAGLVFQNYALFPHLTVAQNVAFGLEMRRVSKADIPGRVDEALRLVRLEHLTDRLPRQLSGGQQQRVALARALVYHPDILLLDEPLSNLDAKLRQEVRVEIRSLQQQIGITTVMVTHDQEEALTMADRLVVMRDGSVQQIGTQHELYEHPVDQFVADFVGRSSFIHVRRDGNRAISDGGLQIRVANMPFSSGVVALRPERVFVGTEPVKGTDNNFTGEVNFISYMGGLIDIHVKLPDNNRVISRVPNYGNSSPPQIGDCIYVGWSSTAAVFPDKQQKAES